MFVEVYHVVAHDTIDDLEPRSGDLKKLLTQSAEVDDVDQRGTEDEPRPRSRTMRPEIVRHREYDRGLRTKTKTSLRH